MIPLIITLILINYRPMHVKNINVLQIQHAQRLLQLLDWI